MADDIAEAHLAWMIDLAEQGDGELLAKHLRENGQAELVLREFLAGVDEGSIRLKPPIKRTYCSNARRYQLERWVLQAVELDMLEHHKKRDKAHRTFLTNKWCEFFGTNQVAVGKYIKSDRGRVKRQRADRKRQLAARK